MSKRGNPDYFKIQGHPAKDPDVDEDAKRLFGESKRLWMRGGVPRWMRPQPPAREIHAAPVRKGDLPWRVQRPQLQTVPLPAELPMTWQTRAIRLVVRAVLAPAHAALSIANALVERVLWRLEKRI